MCAPEPAPEPEQPHNKMAGAMSTARTGKTCPNRAVTNFNIVQQTPVNADPGDRKPRNNAVTDPQLLG